MSEPEFDRNDQDAESMFDFLAEEGSEKPRRKKRTVDASERSLPIIRKPVPVSKSGPLLPPKPGAPIEPPLALASEFAHTDDDLDFLDDVPDTSPYGQSAGRSRMGKSNSDSNITQLDPGSRPRRDERNRTSGSRTERIRSEASGYSNNEFDDLDLDLSSAPEFNRNRQGVSRSAAHEYHDESRAPRRGRWYLLALLLIAAGAGSFLFTNSDNWRETVQKIGTDIGLFTVAGDSDSAAEFEPDVNLPALNGEVESVASPMMQRFREQLNLLEGLVEDGALDEAEQVLSGMDRTTYGYGAAEFGDLEKRIEQLKSGVVVADPASEQAERDEAARVEAEQAARVEAEQAAQAESERLAIAEQAVQDAEARTAAEQAAQAAREKEAQVAADAEQAVRTEEARRIAAAEQAAQEESARLAAAEQSAREAQAKAAEQQAAQEQQAREQAAQEQQAKLDAEKTRQETVRLEQARQDEQARQAALAARTSDWPSVEADRQATDRRIAAERAAAQRQQARAQRLVEAREREDALAAQSASQRPVENEPRESANTAGNDDKVALGPQNISDDELQTVYRRFIDLQQAVSGRDINAVVGLTQRSGARVQQLMQIFENSTQIDARIRNVSTSNATGQIKGTLQINRIKRANGTFVAPPAALSSIPLSSEREGNGWSAISW